MGLRSAIGIQRRPRLGVCSAYGCFGTTIDDEYCPDCRQEIEALDAWYREQETRKLCKLFRRQERVERLRRIGRAVERRLWLLNFGIVLSALAYIGAIYGATLLDWLGVR